MEAEKLTPIKLPLPDALASKVDLYDLVPEIKQKIFWAPVTLTLTPKVAFRPKQGV